MRKSLSLAIFLASAVLFFGFLFVSDADAASITRNFGNQPRTTSTFDFGDTALNPRIVVSAMWCFEDGSTSGCFSDSKQIAVGQTGLIFSASRADNGAGATGPNCAFFTGGSNTFDYCMDIIGSSWDGRVLVLDWEGLTDRNLNDKYGRPFLTSITAFADTNTPNQSNVPTLFGDMSVSLGASPTTIAPGGSATLSWVTSGVTSCQATGGWSGNKPTSGSEVVTPAQSTSYTLVCTNSSFWVADSKTVSVVPGTFITSGSPTITTTTPSNNVRVQFSKLARNITLGQTAFSSLIEAQGGDVLEFQIKVRNTGSTQAPTTIRDLLPGDLFYVQGSTKVNSSAMGDGVTSTSGIFLGQLNPGEEKTVLLRASVISGATEKAVPNQVLIVADSTNQTGTATIQIKNRGKVLGAGTVVTGPEDSIPYILGLGITGALLAYFLGFKYRFGKKSIRSLYSDTRFSTAARVLKKKEGFPDTERL